MLCYVKVCYVMAVAKVVCNIDIVVVIVVDIVIITAVIIDVVFVFTYVTHLLDAVHMYMYVPSRRTPSQSSTAFSTAAANLR